MGFYDRDYYREPRPGLTLRTPQTVVSALILINVALWIVDGLFMPETPRGGRWLSDHMAVHVDTEPAASPWNAPDRAEALSEAPPAVADTLTQPWLWWQYLSYAFAHEPGINHILFNMLALFFLGYDVEAAYGPKEFLRLYLVMAVVAGVVWNIVSKLSGVHNVIAYGASGAIAGVVVLYALNFPQRTLLLFFVLPIPAWLFGVLMVGLDMYGALGEQGGSHVAYVMHLAGAAFALVYYRQRWNLTQWTDSIAAQVRALRRPKLHIHRVEEEEPHDLSTEVDRILEKIYREGEASLTTKERRTLEAASREYQRRGRVGGGKRSS